MAVYWAFYFPGPTLYIQCVLLMERGSLFSIHHPPTPRRALFERGLYARDIAIDHTRYECRRNDFYTCFKRKYMSSGSRWSSCLFL